MFVNTAGDNHNDRNHDQKANYFKTTGINNYATDEHSIFFDVMPVTSLKDKGCGGGAQD